MHQDYWKMGQMIEDHLSLFLCYVLEYWDLEFWDLLIVYDYTILILNLAEFHFDS